MPIIGSPPGATKLGVASITALYTKLEELQTEHDEVTDTDVREALRETLEAASQPR